MPREEVKRIPYEDGVVEVVMGQPLVKHRKIMLKFFEKSGLSKKDAIKKMAIEQTKNKDKSVDEIKQELAFSDEENIKAVEEMFPDMLLITVRSVKFPDGTLLVIRDYADVEQIEFSLAFKIIPFVTELLNKMGLSENQVKN